MRGVGGGRPAKATGQRRSHAKPAKPTEELPIERDSIVPEPIRPLNDQAQALWALLWSSPEASQWRTVDVASVTRLVELQSSAEVSSDSKLLAEVRQLEDRFGLNPYARRQMGWKPAATEPAEPRRTAAQSRRTGAMKVIAGGAA